MRVELKGRKITYLFNDRVIGFETDNLVDTFSCVVDVPGNYKLDVESKQDGCIYHNTISLNYNDELGEYYYIFTAGQLPVGKCLFQLRRINDDKVFLSDKFEAWIKKPVLSYCSAYQEKGPLPSEFYQIESNLDELSQHPPIPDSSGYWKLWNSKKKEYEISDIPVSSETTLATGDGLDFTNNVLSIKTDKKSIIFDKDKQLAIGDIDGGDLNMSDDTIATNVLFL